MARQLEALEALDVIDQGQPTPSIWAFGTVLRLHREDQSA